VQDATLFILQPKYQTEKLKPVLSKSSTWQQRRQWQVWYTWLQRKALPDMIQRKGANNTYA
jgi:hypothetical protein